MAFNRDRSGRGGGFSRGGFKPRFNDRGARGPVQMHQAVCDNCGKSCEVPFRPTSGKPVYCSDCFDKNRGSQRPASFEEKRMFEAVCDECKNACNVPFRPSGDKPIFCSNCFGVKKGAGGSGNGQLETINQKLDLILQLLDQKPTAKKKPSSRSPKKQETP